MTLASAAIGPVKGRLREIFQTLAILDERNNFNLALIIGDVFADPACASSGSDDEIGELLRGDIVVPVPTYFTTGLYALPSTILSLHEKSGGEVCPNLFFLGNKNLTKTSEGLRIAALGGTLLDVKDTGSASSRPSHYNIADAHSLKGVNSADILITIEWPKGISQGSKVDISEQNESHGQQCISEVCAALKPRYHFSVSKRSFFEREPFIHSDSGTTADEQMITRFISLPTYKNDAKQKWIYAFSIKVQPKSCLEVPLGATSSPFQERKKRRNSPSEEFRFSNDYSRHRKPRKYRKHSPQGTKPCFFCLSNPDIATYLVTSIGDDSYLTIAKGPLATTDTYECLKFCAHILIIPMAHIPRLSQIPDAEMQDATLREMISYRRALQDMIEQLSQSRLGAVTWEISRAAGVHAHWQFLPVPVDLIDRGLVEAAFTVEAENLKYNALRRESKINYREESGDSFRVTIWRPRNSNSDDSKQDVNSLDEIADEYSLILPLDETSKFDLQFGRKVLAKLLNLESRLRWQDCSDSAEKEMADAEIFKKKFQPFDFTS